MADVKKYRDYFKIDPKYYAAVTADLIHDGKVKWQSFYPHETFVKLLEKTDRVLSGQEAKSLWIEGAYGTGKSHAALTLKSLLDATDEEVRNYFEEYGLSQTLCQKIITDKNRGKLITVHRIGSSSIHSDKDLIVAVQQSVTEALKAHGIENQGRFALRDAALKWLEDPINKRYFQELIAKEEYAWTFGGKSVDTVIDNLKNGEEDEVAELMKNIMDVADDNGITALHLDAQGMAAWLKELIAANNLSAILFVWDEFTEYFLNNPNSLTGFQTLAEVSEAYPFYFMIVTHGSEALIKNNDTLSKIMDRFVKPIKIELPENMAFKLMAQAMKKDTDPNRQLEWNEYIEGPGGIQDNLREARETIISAARKNAQFGGKTILSDQELRGIVPMHPYAALLLKHLSVAFNSNQRSMFDFIISNDMTDAKGFKWFINEYGPLSETNLLTIDMLWDFFNSNGKIGMSDDVRMILDSYNLLRLEKLTSDEQRVLKTVLLLQAISLRVLDVDMLRPTKQNVDLAFSGTDWNKGKAAQIADKLCKDGILFDKNLGGGMVEYSIANSSASSTSMEPFRKKVRESLNLNELIVNGELDAAVALPASIRGRYILGTCGAKNFQAASLMLAGKKKANRFAVMVSYALTDAEAAQVQAHILKAVKENKNDFLYIDTSVTPMGKDLLDQYVENMAYSNYYAHSEKNRAAKYQQQAKENLRTWKTNIMQGAFVLYTPQNPSGTRYATLSLLQEQLKQYDLAVYPYALERFNATDSMFNKGPLAQGAGCGLEEKCVGQYKSNNPATSLEKALEGAWGVQEYWKDPAKASWPIVHIKKRVDELIQGGFDSSAGRMSILDLYTALEEEPYGFMPNSFSAFVLGFVLKEYATSDYFWSNGSTSETMTQARMKNMIAGAINQRFSPQRNYKEEFIVAMSQKQRAFLRCTAQVFHIDEHQCGSVESARDQMRIKMKSLSFPIWYIKDILPEEKLESSQALVAEVIDNYCGIANTGNMGNQSESDLAENIGRIVHENAGVCEDLVRLVTSENCQKGLLAYLKKYKNGILCQLAAEINDSGAYISRIKSKFSASDANWVWSSKTADEKIDDVILEYQIISRSNKVLPPQNSITGTAHAWYERTENIKISYDAMKNMADAKNFKDFLTQLSYLNQSRGVLLEQNKKAFCELLCEQGAEFEQFYAHQLDCFKVIANSFLDELDEEEIQPFFVSLNTHQFGKSSQEYFQYISAEVERFVKGQKNKQLKDLWLRKTNTKNPMDWSEKYAMPILCMFSDAEAAQMREIFAVLNQSNPSDTEIEKAIDALSNADFFDQLNNAEERDRCFKEKVIGKYTVLLSDLQAVRDSLKNNVPERPYYWMGSASVQNQLRKLADKQYKISGSQKAMDIINKMGADELRVYLKDLIADNLIVGMEIIQNNK